ITLNFKNENNESFLYVDSFSQGECFYKLTTEKVTDLDTKLFVTKSKLKNFGASYHSIMYFDKFDLLKNVSTYYKESEQMVLDFIEHENVILMIQPMPCFEEVQYDLLKEALNNNDLRGVSSENLIETLEVKISNQQRVN